VLLRLRMVAVHCTVPFTATEDAAQEAVIVGVATAGVLDPLPQELRANSTGRSDKITSRCFHRACWRHIEPFSWRTRNAPELTDADWLDGERDASD
jgi:hypothetical protein